LEVIKDDKYAYYSIGFMEGALTYKKIEYFWKTYVANSNFNILNFDIK